MPAALGASALFAYLTGTVCLRTKSVYFIMITLAFGQMAYFIAGSLAPYGGDDGLTVSARSTLFGFPLFSNNRAFYYIVLAFLLADASNNNRENLIQFALSRACHTKPHSIANYSPQLFHYN